MLGKLDGAGDEVGRRQHFHYAFVIADQRSVVLIKQRGDNQDHHHGKHHVGGSQPGHVPPGASFSDIGKADRHRRKNTEQHQPQPHAGCQQGRGLLRVGLEGVLHHIAVDDHAIAEHKVVGGRAAEQEENHQRFTQEGHGQHAEDDIQRAKNHYRHGGGENNAVDVIEADIRPGLMKE
ncbi:hypothetical protein D3C76_1266810 [compost metagenome]